MSTAAEEAAALFDNPHSNSLKTHPEDAAYHSPTHSSDEDVDDHSSNEHNHTYDDDENGAKMPIAIDPISNYHIPRGTAFDANTGPKGVIADARAFEKAKKQKWRFRSSHAVAVETKERSVSPSEKGEANDGEDVDDQEFLDRWRKSEMAKVMSRDVQNRRRSPSVRQFGSMQCVDAVGYLDAIEKVGRETMVVVCIYDDESDVSRQVEDCLASLARKHSSTRFVKLHYEEAEVDVASVPTVLAYRGGDLFSNLTAFVDEVPADQLLTPSTVERVLKKHQILE